MGPTVVAYGIGVDGTAMLKGMRDRGERPDLIISADTGDEKPETYAYLPVINAWLRDQNFPPVTLVKNPRPIAKDKSLSEACLRNHVLPALAYGKHQCSLVWKRDPQVAFVKRWRPAVEAWARGDLVVNCIGYDAGPRDRCRQYRAEGLATEGFVNRFPLVEWGWDRERCEREIIDEGLPVPMKSACFYCPASKKHEVEWLARNHPDLAARALEMERRASQRGLRSIKGLGRNWNWGDYLASKGLVP